MKLSVIIVSYNVKNLLDSCLQTVCEATEGIDAEIFVVDNNSSDNSAAMVAERFPMVHLLANKNNPGFSKANNQALKHARGEYILFLNPDTLVEKQTFRVCIDFMDSNPEAGAMGVKMVDGMGRYLPESKRAVPTPTVAFYKISGLTALFPKSEKYGRYYLGHLDKNKIQKIEVLTGAFFFARKTALDETGWFDESFFMYGEDIDLSCRLLKQGYKIYYHPGTKIVHFKGESTRKSSINYVLVFYRAMAIYAKKHFRAPGRSLLVVLLFIAIYSRAGLSIIKRLAGRIILPVTDAALLYAGFLIFPTGWENRLFLGGQGYPDENPAVLIPALIAIWVVSILLTGGYKTPVRVDGSIRGILLGSIFIILVYAMLSPHWYFKFFTIIPLAIWGLAGTIITRLLILFMNSRMNKNRSFFP